MKKTIVALLTITALLLILLSCASPAAYTTADALLEAASPVSSSPLGEPDLSAIIRKVHFLACGDNIIYGGNVRDAKENALPGGREYNFKPFYVNIAKMVEEADVSFINQETVMAGEGYSISFYPCFNSPQDLGYDLEELGYDVVNIANNHMLDKGTQGLADTIAFWKSRNVLMTGGYESPEDFDDIRVFSSGGVKIAFLSYTYGTNGLVKAKDSPIVVPYLDEDDARRQVALAKEKADVVIVSAHWGYEGNFTPNDEQKHYAKLFADLGVDVVIGHHPHVIQPVEWIEGKNGNRMLCVYSLGNFIGEQAYDYNALGAIVDFDIVLCGDGPAKIENIVFHPTVCHFPYNFLGNVIYLLEDYTPSLAASHGVNTFYRHSLSIDRFKQYVHNTIDPVFLPEALREDE